MATVLLVNIVIIGVLNPQLKITTSDPTFAASLGIRTRAINTAFMFLVSLTVTAAFYAAVLVISLVVAPAATAFLMSKRRSVMVTLTMVIAGAGALAGFWVAYGLNAATSAGIAVCYGSLFFLVYGLSTTTTAARTHVDVRAYAAVLDGCELFQRRARIKERTARTT